MTVAEEHNFGTNKLDDSLVLTRYAQLRAKANACMHRTLQPSADACAQARTQSSKRVCENPCAHASHAKCLRVGDKTQNAPWVALSIAINSKCGPCISNL